MANRGPNDFVWEDGAWVTRTAAGGLVSMLTPLARRASVAWFCCVSEPPDAEQARQGLYTTAADQTDPRLHVVPVPLPAETYHAYYGQISNEVLWMLQHHVIGSSGFAYLDHERHQAWGRYLEANARLAAAIARSGRRPRAFLLQDYHLYPLPALLRGSFPDTPILHFTHIPFPDPPILRLIPDVWRTTILRGMLGADVVGLQTRMDVRSFLACCQELLDLRVGSNHVETPDGRKVCVRAYPASVEPQALRRTMRSPEVAAAHRRLAPERGEMTIIRVDRLDPSKNQQVGFLAFERLLELRPDLRGRVRFLAFLIPSRTDLGVYRAYRDAVYRTIEGVNARFTDAEGGPPIRVFYTNDREQALAAMQSCNVLLINSLQDGMNLVAKEWAVVADDTDPGVLIVSETAGVATDAADSALLISPLDIEGTARAMAEALDMPAPRRKARHAQFQKVVNTWSARDWLEAQLRDLGLDQAVES